MSRENASGELPYTALYGLRALAPIIILTNHWSEGLFTHLLSQQQLSIDIFFAVEGFLVADALFRADLATTFWSMMWKRLVKIYPLYIVGLGASFCLALLLLNAGISEWTPIIVREAATHNLFLLPTFVDEAYIFPLNPPTWAIVLELYAYAVICLLRRWIALPLLAAITLTVTLIYLGFIFYSRDLNMGYGPTTYWGGSARCAFGFFLGVTLFHINRRFGDRFPSVSPLYIWAALIAAMFIPGRLIGLPLLFIGVPILVWLAGVSSEQSYLGKFGQSARRLAYPIYLLHYPVLTAFRKASQALSISKELQASLPYYIGVLGTVFVVASFATYLLDRLGHSQRRRVLTRHPEGT
jgi:peptidoglycan/LPS O-acetylase OafA/YrhL